MAVSDISEIYCAIKDNDIDTVSTYLNSLTNIKWEDTKLVDSLFYHAIFYNRYEIVKMLVCTYHANPTGYNNWSLVLARQKAGIKIIEFLLQKDLTGNGTIGS